MLISDWSSDVCSSDLLVGALDIASGCVSQIDPEAAADARLDRRMQRQAGFVRRVDQQSGKPRRYGHLSDPRVLKTSPERVSASAPAPARSEEHTSELQSLMRISYAVFCLKKNK